MIQGIVRGVGLRHRNKGSSLSSVVGSQLTSVDVVVEGERGVRRAPTGRLGVHHGLGAASCA